MGWFNMGSFSLMKKILTFIMLFNVAFAQSWTNPMVSGDTTYLSQSSDTIFLSDQGKITSSVVLPTLGIDTFYQSEDSIVHVNVNGNKTFYILPPDVYTINYSGRNYLRLNTWSTFQDVNGFTQHDKNQQVGALADPQINNLRNGILIEDSSQVFSIVLKGKHNNAENMDIEYDVTCFERLDNSTATTVKWRKKLTYNTNDLNTRTFVIPINEPCSPNDEIIVSHRKTSGSAALRYFYPTVSLKLIRL